MRPLQVLQLGLLALCWGGAYLFMRASAPTFGFTPMVFLRMALASVLVLLPLALWRSGPGPLLRHWKQLLLFGTAFTTIPFLGLGWSALSISAGMLAILQSAAPLFAAVVGHFWLGEPVGGRRALGLVVGFAGVALLVWDKIGLRGDEELAILVTLAVTVLWGVSSNYAKARLQAIDPVVLAAGSMTSCALVVLPLALWNWPAVMPGPQAWGEVLFLGVASSGIGFLLYFSLIRSAGAVRATTVTFLCPLVTMATAAVYLGEPVSGRMAIGCGVILLGTALTLGLWPRRRV
jgi:drug/metabolite transporter (DMT)-like permease